MTEPMLHDLLVKTSRTFALSIPALPEPARREVTLSYLLLRISDTFEDAHLWSKGQRIESLRVFNALLDRPEPARALELSRRCAAEHPIEHDGYLELMAKIPDVLAAYASLGEESRRVIRLYVQKTNDGMIRTVERSTAAGEVQLVDLQDLRDYCYIVAGLVGELLTELYLLHWPQLAAVQSELRDRARWFGEGLQLVNILKDCEGDAEEGRSFLSPGVSRAEVFAVAREDLRLAEEYVGYLHRARAPRGTLAFNALPVLLAVATLKRVEEAGPGAKISREQVFGLVNRLDAALDRGELLPAEAAAG